VSNRVKNLLVSGPDDNLATFHLAVCMALLDHERRGQTISYTCMGGDLHGALAAAKRADVTVQQIVVTGHKNPRTQNLGGGALVTVSDNVETYETLHLGTHKMGWKL